MTDIVYLEKKIDYLYRKLEREKKAREQAESLLEEKSLELYKNNTKLYQLANYDELTQIPNRMFFNNFIKNIIEESQQEKNNFALLIIDLNDFKEINDTYGHVTGDEILRHIASVLSSHTKGHDTVARLGGDEFAVVLKNISLNKNLDSFCHSLIEGCNTPICIDGVNLSANISIGVSLFPIHGKNIKELLNNADAAMYEAKSKKVTGSTFIEFHSKMNKKRSNSIIFLNKIEKAINEGEFELAYQPYFDLKQQRAIGGEALLRWPSGPKDVNIFETVKAAESSGLILPLGEWVINTACEFIAELHKRNHQQSVSINCSPLQFQHQDVLSTALNAISMNQIDASALKIEVTENLFLNDHKKSASSLKKIHDNGFEIYIDDFGTGYSSLQYLQDLPVDCIKIDKIFIDKLNDKKNNVQIVKAIIDMAHSMGLYVIAEGVETKKQLTRLEEMGCDKIQGYYIAKPLPAHEYIAYLDHFING